MKRQKRQRLKIRIKNKQRIIYINKSFISNFTREILKIKGIKETELSILFASQAYIRKLNKEFRKIDSPTDVLAFNMREGRKGPLYPEILGDVVICPEIAQRFARIYKTTTRQELCLYLIHGILHLLGYNDTNIKNRFLMEKEQRRILQILNKQ